MTPEIVNAVKDMLRSVGADELRRNRTFRVRAGALLRMIYGPFIDETSLWAQIVGEKT